MGFVTAIKTVLSKYVDFSGRARRSEYWWFVLFMCIVTTLAAGVDAALGTDFGADSDGRGLVQTIVGLALLLPGLGVAIRRLHDTGRAGWWILIALIPLLGWIVLLVFYVIDSNPGDNDYGRNPKLVAT